MLNAMTIRIAWLASASWINALISAIVIDPNHSVWTGTRALLKKNKIEVYTWRLKECLKNVSVPAHCPGATDRPQEIL